MVSEEERLREELRAIEEVLAVKENMTETGDWSNYNELQLTECVPQEFQYLDEMEVDALKRRRELIERDLSELRELNYDESDGEFHRHTVYHRGRHDESEIDDHE